MSRTDVRIGLALLSVLLLTVPLGGGCGGGGGGGGNTAPTASFTVAPLTGTAATVFNFDASGSTDAETAAGALEVRWDWTDDGAYDTTWTTTKTNTHQYATQGAKTIRLQVRDAGGLTSTTTRQVTVGPTANTAPTASFTVTPASGTTVTVFNFDASGCADAEDPTSALEVRWDWENSGVYDTGWSTTKTATHQYATDGAKTIRLQVRDTGGLTDETTRTVNVGTANTAPTAAFNVTPTTGDTTTVFNFDASGCTDAEDATSALEVRWDWEDDGTYDTGWLAGKTTTHQYATIGTKTIRLQVRDTGGLTDSVTHTVTVGNTAPTADFSVTPNAGDTTTVFNFDAGLCTDAEDPVTALEVRWDWTNDGTYDTAWNTNKIYTHTYATDGVKTIRLEVRDTGALTDSTTKSVTVAPDTEPVTIIVQ